MQKTVPGPRPGTANKGSGPEPGMVRHQGRNIYEGRDISGPLQQGGAPGSPGQGWRISNDASGGRLELRPREKWS
jgi:hypothetical protein